VTGYVTTTGLNDMPLLSLPQRVVDTRQAGGAIASGGSRCFTLAGQAGIPGDAAAVWLNTTVVGSGVDGWLTLYPAGEQQPPTSTLNFAVAEYAVANGVLVRLGGGGQVCTSVGSVGSVPGSAQVILDVTGYLTATGLKQMPLLGAPQRLVDTRAAGGAVPSGSTRCFGLAGIPGTAKAAILNVTAAGYSAPGWISLYPSGQSVPATSTVNFDTGQYAMANGSIVKLGPDGEVCASIGTLNAAPGSAHVILDVSGYLLP
jgi:hypothetical protein